MSAVIGRFKHKGIELTAWEQPSGAISFTLRKSYKDKRTGQWLETKTFFPSELQAVAELALRAGEWAKLHKHVDPPTLPRNMFRASETVDAIFTKMERQK